MDKQNFVFGRFVVASCGCAFLLSNAPIMDSFNIVLVSCAIGVLIAMDAWKHYSPQNEEDDD